MDFQLRQRGRASMDFLIALTGESRPLMGTWNGELADARGAENIDEPDLPRDRDTAPTSP